MVGKTKEVSNGIGMVPPAFREGGGWRGRFSDGGAGPRPEDAAVSDGAQQCPGHDGSIYPCQHGKDALSKTELPEQPDYQRISDFVAEVNYSVIAKSR